MTKHRNNPRRQITLHPELNEALEELREKTGLSISGFINDMMMGTIPHIKAIISAYQALDDNNRTAKYQLKQSLTSITNHVNNLHSQSEELSSFKSPAGLRSRGPHVVGPDLTLDRS